MHLCTNSTVTSSVNGTKFSVVNNSDLDWKSIDLIYVLKFKYVPVRVYNTAYNISHLCLLYICEIP